MLKNRLRVVKNVTEKLTALEAAIDDALICAGDLTVSVSTGRQEAKLSAVVGQEAVGLTGEALQSLYTARAKIVEAHNEFAVVRDKMGMRTHAGGPLWKLVEPSAANNEQHETAETEKQNVA